jgi:hypothetical protein
VRSPGGCATGVYKRGVGAIMLVSFAAASLGGLVVTLWGQIVALFNG